MENENIKLKDILYKLAERMRNIDIETSLKFATLGDLAKKDEYYDELMNLITNL